MTDPARYIVGSDKLTDGIGLRGFGTDGSPLWARDQRANTLARHRDGWFVAGLASRVRRFDATGRAVWEADAGGTIYAVAVNLADRVVAGTNHGVRVLGPDGVELWSRPSPSRVRAVAIDTEGRIAAVHSDGRVDRRDADGALIWSAERGAMTLAVALTSAGGVIAAGVPDANGDHLAAYDPDGARLWSTAAGSAPHLWTLAVDDRGHITTGGAPDGGIVARQLTGGGDPVWSSTAADPGQIRALSVTPDGTILTAGAWGSGAKVALLDAADGTVIWSDAHFDRAASTAAAPGVRGGGHWRLDAERTAHGTAAATLGAIGGKRTGGAAAPVVGLIGAAAAARTARAVGTVWAGVDGSAAAIRLTQTTVPIKTGVTLAATGLTNTGAPTEPPIATVELTASAIASLEISAGRIVAGTAKVRALGTIAAAGHKCADRTGTLAARVRIAGHGRVRRLGVLGIAAAGTGWAETTGLRANTATLHAAGTGRAGVTATHFGRARLGIGSHARAAVTTAKPTSTLLPSSATNEMRALESVTTRATDLPALHRHNADPERVRSQLLPWQAWERAVDIWDHQWDDATKRAVSGRALATHRIRGTPAAVESALTSLGVDDAELTEWFEEDPQGLPYTFRATVTRAGGIERGLSRNLGRAVAASKNTRSHMTRLTLVVPMAATTLYAAPAAIAGQAVTVAPLWDPPGAITGPTASASATHTVTAVTVPAHNEAPENEDFDA